MKLPNLIRIETGDDGPYPGTMISIKDADTGRELKGAFRADVSIVPDDLVRVNIGFHVEKIAINAVPKYFLISGNGEKDGFREFRPFSHHKEIKKVVFTDGTEWNVEDGTELENMG